MDAGLTAPVLHVTNGDEAVARLVAAGVAGRIVPWRDVLHDGPVPAGLDADALRAARARYIASAGWATYEAVFADFALRDAAIEDASAADETTLWFEHDLYDQLQLLQLLDRFVDRPARYLTLAQSDDSYLGNLEPDAVRALWARRREVTPGQLALARDAWAAFRSDDPRDLERLLTNDTSALPHLAPTIRRLLEELPSTRDGLSRTERQMLEAITAGAPTLGDVFRETAGREERIWLGDSSLARYVERLSDVPAPLLLDTDGRPLVAPVIEGDRGFWRRRAVLTALGERVLSGDADRVAEAGLDRWIGGTHLAGRSVRFRWDGARVVAA
jgi:hypothetical protein